MLTFCAIAWTGANTLAERAFAPKVAKINLAPLARVLSDLSPVKDHHEESQKNLKAQTSNNQTSIEDKDPLNLEATDFIPKDIDELAASAASAPQQEKVAFLNIKKHLDIKAVHTLGKQNQAKTAINSLKGSMTINGEDPVKLYGFANGPKIKPTRLAANFKPIEIEKDLLAIQKEKAILAAATPVVRKLNQPIEQKKTEKEKDKSRDKALDRISTAMAATEKSVNDKISKKNILPESKSEELVFFDYSSAKDPKEPKPKEAKKEESRSKTLASLPKVSAASSAVTQSSGNSLGQSGLIKEMVRRMGKDLGAKQVADKKSSQPQKEVGLVHNMNGDENSTGLLAKKMNNQNYKSVYRLTTQSVSLKGKVLRKLSDYEIRFADDIDEIARADAEGSVVLENILNSDYGIRRGTIFSGGHYPVSTDFVLEGQEVNLSIPLITEESFNWMLEKEGLMGLGGHILIELDQLTEDVELDFGAKYEEKLFLDRRMRVVSRGDADYSYILFVGVEPGNKIISFKTYKNEVASKIIHVTQDEIYFDFNFYAAVKNDEFELFEENLLSKETGILSVDENEILDLSYDTKFVKKTVNRLQAKKALYPVGTRKYYELRHLKESVYVGRWSSDYVDVPSESYIRFALSNFQGYNLEHSCVVQINLEKQAKELFYNGRSFRGHMRITPRILDTDGIFYTDLSHQSKRIFLLGEEQGAISVKVKYVDNSVDYLQTFCSKSNYVVEQL